MQKENHYYKDLEYLKGFNLIPLNQLLENLQPETIETVFKTQMTEWVAAVIIQYVLISDERFARSYATKYVENGEIKFQKDSLKYVGFYKYAQVVLHEIKQLNDTVDANPEIINNKIRYTNYLNDNIDRFKKIDALVSFTSDLNNYDNIALSAKKLVKELLIDVNELNKAQQRMFWQADNYYLIELLHNKPLKVAPLKLDMEYYQSPPIYVEFPDELMTYRKFLKGWILEKLSLRKRTLKWDTQPIYYVAIESFSNNLIENGEQPAVEEVTKKRQLPKNTEYPYDIFYDEQAYLFFNFLMKHFATVTTIGFFFKTMSEIEKPKLIKVKDVPFREWYNNQTYKVPLEYTTKTYNNSKSDDRIASYNALKELFYSS